MCKRHASKFQYIPISEFSYPISESSPRTSVSGGSSPHTTRLRLELRQQAAHGLSLQASYTLSHATGTNSGPLYAGVFRLPTTPGDTGGEKAALPTGQRHRAVFNWTWAPTLTHNGAALTRYLANGWQFSSIATLASGQPLSQTLLPAGNQFSGLTMAYFNSLNGSGRWARVPLCRWTACAPTRSAVWMPGSAAVCRSPNGSAG